MAFKQKYTAVCDSCGDEITVWAKTESLANKKFEQLSGWEALGNNHLCYVCKHKGEPK